MKITHDRELLIAVGRSRKTTQWQHKELLWSEFLDKLSTRQQRHVQLFGASKDIRQLIWIRANAPRAPPTSACSVVYLPLVSILSQQRAPNLFHYSLVPERLGHMDIEIRKLTPDMAQDFARFFDATPHSDNVREHKCYCVCWASVDSRGEDYSSAVKRRAKAIEYVEARCLQGYMAFAGDTAVGWVNVNVKSECYLCESWLRFMQDIERDDDNATKSVFCFTIAPEYRGKGVASALLARVCADARAEGFEFVEAYPNKRFINTEHDFMGPVSMYEKQGFETCYEAGQRLVMRKRL